MSLAPGTRLGPYAITALVGAGGMGEVYAATDTRLGRTVAVKVLPSEVSRDPDRRARFEREARTVGAISHPNIVAIHDVGTVDNLTFLVMELLDGETLRARLSQARPSGVDSGAKRARGGLPLQKVLDIAAQVALGLAAAHARGIVHRDLKPENIFLTRDGRVKVLDFGLARAIDVAFAQAETRTRDAAATHPGMVMGTVGYMAPEQVRGKEVDHRADLFAFGAVLFEMLTGASAFAAESSIETMSAILNVDPLERRALVADLPAAVEGLVRHCLEKQPDERFQSARDLAFQLQALGSGATATVPAAVVGRAGIGRPRGWMTAAAMFLGGAIVTGAGLTWLRSEPSVSPAVPMHSEIVLNERFSAVAISPLGDRVVYRGGEGQKAQLYQRQTNSRESTAIAGTASAGSPSFSPDGRSIAFFANQRLKTVSLDGGAVLELWKTPNAFGLGWGPDGHIVFNNGPNSILWRIREKGGTAEPVTTLNGGAGEAGHRWPTSFLNGGRQLLFAIWYGGARYDVAVFDFTKRQHWVLVENTSFALYAASGHLLYARADGVYARAFDQASLTFKGSEVRILGDVWLAERSNFANMAISQDGTLVYRSGHPPNRQLVLVDLAGQVQVLGAPPRRYAWPQFSPDGRRIVVMMQEGPYVNSWVIDRLGVEAPRRIPLTAHVLWPIWTRDGSGLIFTADLAGAGKWKIYRQIADGTQPPVMVFDPGGSSRWYDFRRWSDDSTAIGTVFKPTEDEGTGQVAIVALDLKDSAKPVKELLALEPQVAAYNFRVSPDGRAMAYVSMRSGREEIYVAPMNNLRQSVSASRGFGIRAVWAPDSRKLYYVASGQMMEVDVNLSTSPVTLSTPRVRFGEPLMSTINFGDHFTVTNWDVSPDGKHFVMIRGIPPDPSAPADPTATQLRVITNLLTELRQKAPGR